MDRDIIFMSQQFAVVRRAYSCTFCVLASFVADVTYRPAVGGRYNQFVPGESVDCPCGEQKEWRAPTWREEIVDDGTRKETWEGERSAEMLPPRIYGFLCT